MASYMKEYEHLEIQLEDIKSATNNFDESKVIGIGGFGKVYAGELSLSKGRGMAALKRLDRKHGQGDPQFWKEIMMLSRYTHENLISLLGFCNKEGEMILVYEHASRGSLDRYLKDATLTWTERIKICLDAAKGLSFLHNPNDSQQRVLHCDVKSANILLDDNLNAKVSDFGLSKMGSAEQQFSVIITNPVGTPGYCDPLYMETYQLTKESDVYSFGVVLFEVLCGRQCFELSNGQLNVFVHFWKKTYEENKLEDIIFKDLKQQMNRSALETFASIAYQCLKRYREQRPTMPLIVKKLKDAFEVQERHDILLKLPLPKEYEDIVLSATSPLMYTSIEELKELVSKGVLVNNNKTLLYINEKGERIERLYIEACLNRIEANLKYPSYFNIVNSRFPGGRSYYHFMSGFKAHVRGQYLTPQISYTVNLDFRYQSDINSYNPLRYKVNGEAKVFIIYPSIHVREDGWLVTPLYQFTSQHKTADLQFEFEDRGPILLVAGIEFQPYEEKVDLQVTEEYQDIVKAASQYLFYRSLDQLKLILSTGVHLNGYKTWFSLNEKGQHCHMISIEDCLIPNEDFPSRYKSHIWSRFPAGLYQTNNKGFKTHVKTQLLSPSVTYTVNLVISSNSPLDLKYVDLKYRLRGETTISSVYLATQRREDWMYIAELYQFTSDGSIVDLEINFGDHRINNTGVEGILFQPLEIVEDQVSKDKVENIQTTRPTYFFHVRRLRAIQKGSRPGISRLAMSSRKPSYTKKKNIQTISDSELDTEWEQKLPNDYEEILNLSKDSMQWTTKKELYSILRRGFLIDNGLQWFAVDKHGKKCLVLSARETWVTHDGNSAWESSHESRFGEVLVITGDYCFVIRSEVKSQVVSPKTTYAAYLVFKLPQDQSTFEAPIQLDDKNADSRSKHSFIYLASPPHTPVIGPKLDENSYNPLNRYKRNAIPQQRTDGWMEVKLWEFHTTTKSVRMLLFFKHPGHEDLKGLIVQGIELRPI